MVAIPVRCPKCGAVGLSEFPVVVVAIALVKWNNMCLYAPCHEGGWDAGERELEAIRQHLGRDWIWEHGQSFLKPHPSNVTFLDLSDRDTPRKISVGQISVVRRGAVLGRPMRLRQARDVN
jgi:hypothetical protein